MKILVTVGTTVFDELVKYLDSKVEGHEFVFQIGSGKYIPKNHCFFRFSSEFDSVLEGFEYIITHAGAGSVYSFLEKSKKIIVVPNLFRIDKHQQELAKFVFLNNYGFVAWRLKELDQLIQALSNYSFVEYKKNPFSKSPEISNLIYTLYSDQ